MEERPTSKLTVMIPYTLRRRFKAACVEADTDMSEVVRKCIERWLQEQKTGVAGKK
jgi:hypothetical protein